MKKIITLIMLLAPAWIAAQPAETGKERQPAAGMLYFATYDDGDSTGVIENPYISGVMLTILWSEVESRKGIYDWTDFDKSIERWVAGGKKVAIRIMWSTSGYWRNPQAAHPTPKWVWEEGAEFAYHPESKTEIPLIWDPVFHEYAMRFQHEVNRKYGSDPDILFIDVTPGAETNPYRFGTINRRDPAFKAVFARTQASDGSTYSNELWVKTVCDWITETASIFTSVPCLVTLNVGSLQNENNFPVIGQCAVDNGMYVGQNGLNANSYNNNDVERTRLFRRWSEDTKLFFEMVHPAETSNTGTLKGVMEAAERIGCDYLNVYGSDVIKSSSNIPSSYQPAWEEAMKAGYGYFNSKLNARPLK